MRLQSLGHPRRALVREALHLAPVKPDLAAGLRAGVATAVPLLLAGGTSRPELSYAGLAGFAVVLVDKGGAYRVRARSMLTMALAGALATFLGTLAAPFAWLGAALVLLVVGLGGFVRMFGAEATAIGVLTSVALVVGLARPAPGPASAAIGAGFYLAGALWAALASLVLWPLRLYRPSRLAIARALRAFAEVAQDFVGARAEADAQVRRRAQIGRARQAVEAARGVLGSSRRARAGPSRRGVQLVALLEASDLLLGSLVALDDALALAPDATLGGQVDQVAARIAKELRDVAAALEAETALPASAATRRLRERLELALQGSSAHVPHILVRALERLERTRELARAIDDPSIPLPLGRTEPSELSTSASAWSLLRDHLTLGSAMFRHALRMAISTALVLLLTHALHVEHGYWATLACLVILQPYATATWARAIQRVLGTVLGAGIALLLATWVETPLAMLAIVFGFVALARAVLPLNYAAFAVLLTPAFVLLAESQTHTELAGVRVLDTLFGAFVALMGSRLLFPLSERDQFRPLMAEAISAVQHLLTVASSPEPSQAGLREARRRVGLAQLNAEASFQRLQTETRMAPQESEAALTLVLYVYRLASGLIALAEAEHSAAHAELVQRAPELERCFEPLREGLLSGRPTPGPRSTDTPEATERVDTLFEQLEVLRTALWRWNTHSALPG